MAWSSDVLDYFSRTEKAIGRKLTNMVFNMFRAILFNNENKNDYKYRNKKILSL